MKRSAFTLTVACVIAVFTIAFCNPCQAQVRREWGLKAEEFGWKLNYDEAKEAARAANKPMMVVFRCVP